MFSSLGLFKDIPCPKINDCSLHNCLFNHSSESNLLGQKAISTQSYDPLSAGNAEIPAAKRRRLDTSIAIEAENASRPLADTTQQPLRKGVKPVVVHGLERQEGNRLPRPSGDISNQTSHAVPQNVPQSKPTTITRPISPPAKTKPKVSTSFSAQTNIPPEKLFPRQVAKSPVPFKSRLSYVELLFKIVRTHNSKAASAETVDKTTVLGDQELIKLILDDEENAASAQTTDLYKNTMSQHYLKYKNMSFDAWKAFIRVKFQVKPEAVDAPSAQTISTGLDFVEEIELLRGLKTSVVGLELYGYVTTPPSASDIEKARTAISIANGFEVCDRCGTRFQVFPGRNATGRLTTQGECYYHWAKAYRPQTARGPRVNGHMESSHPCCNKPPGSEGCTMADTHVYKVTDPKRLATILQFERTPPQVTTTRRAPVAFDCEMAYTTYGMELVRVTAISWSDNKTLLDVLVRPYGEILDLNTRFSGVSKREFANAPVYQGKLSGGNDDSMQAAEPRPNLLHKVESLSFARQLMFDLLTPDTPLIGHAIENDLNACRMIHPFIIDTVLLYPHPAGLPARYGLKQLASKYLHRAIQMGGAQGHDSKEDSVATGDLVKVKVAEKWKSMKLQGWGFEDGRLLAPARLKAESRV